MTPDPAAAVAPELVAIAVLLARVATDIRPVSKSDVNEAQGFQFRGVDAVLREVAPALRAHGVIVTPLVEAADFGTVEIGQRRTVMRQCTLRVRFAFHGPAGDHLDAVVVGEAIDSGDKAASKAMSVALRTVLIQVFTIPVGDRDPDHDSYERAPAADLGAGDRRSSGQKFMDLAAAAGYDEQRLVAELAERYHCAGTTLRDIGAQLTDAQKNEFVRYLEDIANTRTETAEERDG